MRRSTSPSRPTSDCGFSLIETVLAVLLIGGALATVLSMVTTSVKQMGSQKMQAAAIGFASGQMNRLLFEEEFEDVLTTGYTEVAVDGVSFRYKVDVEALDNADLHYTFTSIPWHSPTHGGAAGAEPSVPDMTVVTQPISQLDAKFTSANPVLKDLLLTVEWHGPGETYRDDWSLKLVSRKARL